MKSIFRLILLALFVFTSGISHAAYESRFDAINYDPAIDGGNYLTVYGSRNLKAWQGTLGFEFDYANRPLEFRATGGANGRQSVLDHTYIVNLFGALGFTDWFEAGINIPLVAYNRFFTDNVAASPDHGGGMGDILMLAKFRILDIEEHKVGFAVATTLSLPTGDIVRYNGNGHIMGGLKLIFDARLHERLELALNIGGVMRDDVTRNFTFAGGAVSSVRVDDLFTYGLGANIKFGKNWEGIVETQGSTVIRNFFSNTNTTSLEAGGAVRYYFGQSGFSVDVGGAAGLIEGIGTPRFRANVGLTWKAQPKECPECAPDPRIQGNKIVLWGKIFYDTAKATIKPISYPVLDDVVDVLNKHPEITLVEVQGHTDFRGSDSYNQKLSQRRAQSAMQYLINKGISPSRLTARGYGEAKPIATNKTVEGMSQNRRTEFIILNSGGNYVTPPNPAEINATPTVSQQTYAPQTTQTAVVAETVTTETVSQPVTTTASANGNTAVNPNRPVTDSGMPNYSGDI